MLGIWAGAGGADFAVAATGCGATAGLDSLVGSGIWVVWRDWGEIAKAELKAMLFDILQ